MDVPYPPEADPEVIAEVVHPTPKGWRRWLKLAPVAVIAAAAALVFATGLNRYLSLDMLQEKRELLLELVARHPITGLLAYMGAYAVMVALSVPGALIMTMTGGFLFGPLVGASAAVIGMTVGATIMFLVARSALGDFLKRHTPAGGMVSRVEAGVRANAFLYLLVLRLLPAVPFWLCNLASGFVNIPLRTYLAATIVGIIPSTFIYASIGAGLGHVFDRGEKPNLNLISDPQVLFPLIGLVALSLLPLLYHAWRVRRGRRSPLQVAE
jgi:uncharacterized membrane protein YdjX (TVP38/TMEM64 family)